MSKEMVKFSVIHATVLRDKIVREIDHELETYPSSIRRHIKVQIGPHRVWAEVGELDLRTVAFICNVIVREIYRGMIPKRYRVYYTAVIIRPHVYMNFWQD